MRQYWWKYGRWVLLGVFILYGPSFACLYRLLVNPESTQIAGKEYRIAGGWRIVFDGNMGDARSLLLSKPNVLMPWTKGRKIQLIENYPLGMMPKLDNNKIEIHMTSIGSMQAVPLLSLPVTDRPPVLSGVNYVGMASGVLIQFERIEDINESLSVQ